MIGPLRKTQVTANHLSCSLRIALADHKGAFAIVTRLLDHAFEWCRRAPGGVGKHMPLTARNQHHIAGSDNNSGTGRKAHMAAPLDYEMEPRGLRIGRNGNGPGRRKIRTEVKRSSEPYSFKDI